MDLADLIAPDGVYPSLKAKTKKQALQDVAQKASALTGISARDILDTLLQRERLGSTGVGRGIAIPHGRLPALKSIVSVFARLDEPIDFEALDNEPVDLIFLLLAPEHAGADHLKALARISRLLREPSTIERLRASRDRAALYSVLTEPAVHAV
jgi:PTS system nitrogen regulatory IIA component